MSAFIIAHSSQLRHMHGGKLFEDCCFGDDEGCGGGSGGGEGGWRWGGDEGMVSVMVEMVWSWHREVLGDG